VGSQTTDQFTFMGFHEPEENYFRLLNNWFELIQPLREMYGTRLIAPLKVLEYILKHTWGYGRFDQPIALSIGDIRFGRRIGRQRMDMGTGLAENTVRKALEELCKLGYIEKMERLGYRPRLRPTQTKPAARRTDPDGAFLGFAPPSENYFKIPKEWTDITCEISSAATLLCVEYFIRHAWGWHNPDGSWLEASEVASGRQYLNGTRYDPGVGFDLKSAYRALDDAVGRGLLVWTDRSRDGKRRIFNLHLAGMEVSPEGEYLGRLPWESEMEHREWRRISGLAVKDAAPDAVVQPATVIGNLEGAMDNLEVSTGAVEDHAITGNLEGDQDKLEAQTGNPDRTAGKNGGGTGESAAMSGNNEAAVGEAAGELIKYTPDNTSPPPDLILNPHPEQTTTAGAPTGAPDLLDAVAVSGTFADWLDRLQVQNPSRRQLLADPHGLPRLIGWVLYAHSQAGLTNPLAYAIRRALDRDQPPPAFAALSRLPLETWQCVWMRRAEIFLTGADALPPDLRGGGRLILREYDRERLEMLPGPLLDLLADAGVGNPADSGVDDLDDSDGNADEVLPVDAPTAGERFDEEPPFQGADPAAHTAWLELLGWLRRSAKPDWLDAMQGLEDCLAWFEGDVLVVLQSSPQQAERLTWLYRQFVTRHLQSDPAALAGVEFQVIRGR